MRCRTYMEIEMDDFRTIAALLNRYHLGHLSPENAIRRAHDALIAAADEIEGMRSTIDSYMDAVEKARGIDE